jgi:hypothetical protein
MFREKNALLQKGKALLPLIVLLCEARYSLGYLPEEWRDVKVVYILKAGTKDPEQRISYRPISLTTFFSKTMEKLLHLNIVRHPQHQMQLSTFIILLPRLKKCLGKESVLSAFVDIQGAFDHT